MSEFEEMKAYDVSFQLMKEWADDRECLLTESGLKYLRIVTKVTPPTNFPAFLLFIFFYFLLPIPWRPPVSVRLYRLLDVGEVRVIIHTLQL